MASDPVRTLAERAKALLEQRQSRKSAKPNASVSDVKHEKRARAIAHARYERRVRDLSLPQELLAKLASELSLAAKTRIDPPSGAEWLADAVILALRLRPLMVRSRNQNETMALFCREVARAAVELCDCDPVFREYLEEEYFPETFDRAFSYDDPQDRRIALWCAFRVVVPRILRSIDEEYGLSYEVDSSVDLLAEQLAAARTEVRRKLAKETRDARRERTLPSKSAKEERIERDHAARLRKKRSSLERYLQNIDVNRVENDLE